jgi:S-formylglutathione hydrolase FrmB
MDGKTPAKNAAGSSASSAPQLKPPTPSARAARMERITLASKARKKETAFYAFIPLDTGEKKRRPALYLLHGAWDNHAAWKDHAELWLRRLAEEHGLIIITPDGDPFGWYADSPYDPANQIETYLLNELIPKVEKDLFALPGKRSVAGLSMGGHGAMTLTLGHPGLFSSASSMSGVLDITMHQAKKWELDRVFGPFDKNQEIWERHSAVGILTALEKVKAPPLLVTVGRSDPWVLGDNRLFHEKLKSLGVAHDYQEKAGGHDWAFWTSELPEHVAFHAKILSGKARP